MKLCKAILRGCFFNAARQYELNCCRQNAFYDWKEVNHHKRQNQTARCARKKTGATRAVLYGCRDGSRIIPKNAYSPAFELTPEKEARLVKLGIAKYVATAPAKQNDPSAYNADMKINELKVIAADYYNIDADTLKKAISKVRVIELIEESKAAAEHQSGSDLDYDAAEDTDEDATPPSLMPAEPSV